jgi:hypothetical protein
MLEHISEPKSIERSLEPDRGLVAQERPIDGHPDLLAVLLELPAVGTAIGWPAHHKAAVVDEVPRMDGNSAGLEIGRGADHSHAEIIPKSDGNHVALQPFPETHACVEAG